MRSTLSTVMFLGCLLTLPWVGMGLIHFLTGQDVGGGLQPSWFFMALAIIFLFFEKIHTGHLPSFRTGFLRQPSALLLITAGTFLAVFLSVIGLSLVPSLESLSTGLARWSRQVIQLLIMYSFVWWAALWVRGTRRWQLTLDFLFIGAIFQLIYSLAQGVNFYLPMSWFSSAEIMFKSNPSILSGSEKLYLNNILQEIPRLRGTVCEPLYFGNFILMAWPFLLVWRRPLAMRLTLGFLLFVLLVLTWSRGAWLGFLAQLFLIFLVFIWLKFREKGIAPEVSFLKRFKNISLFLAGILIFFTVLDSFTGHWILHRLLATFNNQDWSNLTRLYSMEAAWLGFLESPVVGLGWGQFAFHFPLLVDPMGLQSQFSWPVVNNFPLQVLSETGLVGFSLFLIAGGILVKKSWLVMASRPNLVSSECMVFPAALSLWGVWVQLLSFSQYNLPHIWIGLGLLLAALAPTDGFSEEAKRKNHEF